MYKLILFLYYLFSRVCDSARVDSIKQCKIKDSECLRRIYNSMFNDVVVNGSLENGIPTMDPYRITDFQVLYRRILNVTMNDGLLHGLSNCIFESFMMDIDRRRSKLHAVCDFKIEGQYKLTAHGPLIGIVFGGCDMTAEGNVTIKIGRCHLILSNRIHVQKGYDDKIHMLCKTTYYNYTIFGKLSICPHDIYIDDEDVTERVTQLFNNNWKSMLDLFGKPFFDQAVGVYSLYANRYLESVPVSQYVSDDMTPYLEK